MNHSRVVVGVDGSPLSQTAVLQAAHFASSRGMSLHLLHAFAPDLPMLGFGELADHGAVTAYGRRLLQDAAARAHAAHPGLTVTSALTEGYASHALVSASRSAALVVVGSVGHGVLSRASMGAVAMQVLTHSRCPVLVVGHESTGGPVPGGRVVVGVDGSRQSLEAVRLAVREAEVLGGVVEAVHAWQARGATDPTLSSAASWEDYVEEVGRRVDAVVDRLRATHPDAKVVLDVVREDPVRALTARAEGASLLVVGSRGGGGFGGLHVGSTAMRLVGRSSCPTLVTR